jgi:hypothetical protein
MKVQPGAPVRVKPLSQPVHGLNQVLQEKIINPLIAPLQGQTRARRAGTRAPADGGQDTVSFETDTNDGRAVVSVPIKPVLPVATVSSLTASEHDTASGDNAGGTDDRQTSYAGPDALYPQATTCSDDVCQVFLDADTSTILTDTQYRTGDDACQYSTGPVTTSTGWGAAVLNLHFDGDGELVSADVDDGPNEEVGNPDANQPGCLVSALGSIPWADVPVSVAALKAGQPVSVSLTDSGSAPAAVSLPAGMTVATTYSMQMTFQLNGPLDS